MYPDISPLCRFCLESNEEFHHLATECPPLWWERHHISAQESVTSSSNWSPQQIVNFTFIPRINEAFVRPLYQLEPQGAHADRDDRLTQDMDVDDPNHRDVDNESASDISVMDVSSLANSTDYDDGESIISVCSSD